MRTKISLLVAASVAALALSVLPADGQEPPPPSASEPAAQDNPDVTFHAAPKPLPAGAMTSDWTSYLGPTHDMHSPETKLLHEFPPGGPTLVWEMNKGESYSAPAVAGERLVFFHRVKDEEVVECLNAQDGRRFWSFRYGTEYVDRYNYNRGPRCSPVIAGDSVFTFGAEGKLHCLDLSTGQMRWRRDILKEFKLKQNFFGTGSTPLVEANDLIVNVGAPGGPCVAAFDLRSGEFRWGAGSEWGPSYATPVPATWGRERHVLVFAGGESDPPIGGLLCIDPASGKIEGQFPWRGKRFESVNASSPVAIGNRVFISEAYGRGGAMVAVADDGNCSAVWTNKNFATHFITSIAEGGYLYGADGYSANGMVCVDANTGAEVWRFKPAWEETVENTHGQKKVIKFGTARCSLLRVDGRYLCLGEFGHLIWMDLTPLGHRELSRVRLFTARDTWTPPVLSKGLLYVCQNTPDPFAETPPRLLCYDLRGE